MKQVIISDKNLGSIEVKSKRNMAGESEFAVKALAGLMMICIGRTAKTDPKLIDVLQILQGSIDRIHNLYQEDKDESALRRYS